MIDKQILKALIGLFLLVPISFILFGLCLKIGLPLLYLPIALWLVYFFVKFVFKESDKDD